MSGSVVGNYAYGLERNKLASPTVLVERLGVFLESCNALPHLAALGAVSLLGGNQQPTTQFETL